MSGLEHTIILRQEEGEWKIVSDNYNDYLWRILRKTGISADALLNAIQPLSIPRSEGIAKESSYVTTLLPADPSSHDYNRQDAVEYAIEHALNYNPDYYDYTNSGGDCTNFVSQAVYEGGNASMDVELNPSQGGYQWYYLNETKYAAAWTFVDNFYNFVTASYDVWEEGPDGYLVTNVNELMLGDVIQYETNGRGGWDHSAFVVDFDGEGDPIVASHTPNNPGAHYLALVPSQQTRFIHIERSDGNPPVNTRIATSSDDAGTNPGSCAFSSTNNETYLGACFGGGDITGGFRFNDIHIPQGAYIKYAYLIFTVDGDYSVPIVTQIYGETDTAPGNTFTVSNPPESRATTDTAALWVVTDQIIDFWKLEMRRSPPDLKALVQEIVQGSGWSPGDTLSFIFKNAGSTAVRRVIAFDRTDTEPHLSPARLLVAYSLEDPAPDRPIVKSITRASPNPTGAASVDFTVTFSEPVTGVGIDDFALTTVGVSGAAVSGGSGGNDTYTVSVGTGSGNGVIRLDVIENASITDLESNPLYGGFTNGQAYTIDRSSPPTVLSIIRAGANPTSAASVDFTVAFSEAVTGVEASDFSLAVTGDISGASVSTAAAAGSQAVYTVTVDAGVGGGALRLDIPITATIADLTGTPLAGLPYQSGEEYTILVTAPGKAVLTFPSGDIGDIYYPAYTWLEVAEGGTESISTQYYLWVNGPSGNIIKHWYPAAEVCSSGVCSVTPSTALGGGAHTWWVQTSNSAGNGPWSDAMTFDTAPPTVPGKAALVSPSGDIGDDYTPLYIWSEVTESEAESMSTWYYLWVNGPTGNVIKQWYQAVDVCNDGACFVRPSTILGSGSHTWWVQTWNAAGYGPWSDAMNFIAP
ncbi:MAG: amidase domain-containing protein [Chloroflexota bacterium]